MEVNSLWKYLPTLLAVVVTLIVTATAGATTAPSPATPAAAADGPNRTCDPNDPAGCNPEPPPICADHLDNDGDHMTDAADPACATSNTEWPFNNPPPPPPPPPPPGGGGGGGAGGDTDPFPGGWTFEDDVATSTGYGFILSGGSNGLPLVTLMTCKTAAYTKTAKSFVFRKVLFRMVLQSRWCWAGARIVEQGALCYSKDVDTLIQADNCPAPQGIWFGTQYDYHGGFEYLAQNTYKNCLPNTKKDLTCWHQSNIVLHMRVFAGGAFDKWSS